MKANKITTIYKLPNEINQQKLDNCKFLNWKKSRGNFAKRNTQNYSSINKIIKYATSKVGLA